MDRTLALITAALTASALFAQQPPTPPNVVKSDAKEMKPSQGGAPVVAPAQDAMTWEFTGAFDSAPAHTDCAAMVGDERNACTAQRVLQGIRSQGKVDPTAVALVVEVSFGVNEYGEVKDIKLHGIADEPFMRKAIVALYAMPKFAYATKADVRIGSHCLFRIPAAMLTAPTGQ